MRVTKSDDKCLDGAMLETFVERSGVRFLVKAETGQAYLVMFVLKYGVTLETWFYSIRVSF